jgi:hypothetical protein
VIELAGQMKSPSVKAVNDSFSFDIAKYDYDNQIALSAHNFKEKCLQLKMKVGFEN